MAGAAGAGGLAVATYNDIKNRQPKYYGNLAIGPSSPTHAIADKHDNNRVQAGQQEQYDPYRPNPHASWLSQASAINPLKDNTVPAGGGAYVPALAPTIHDQSRQSPEMDAFGGNGGGGDGGKRGSWLLKGIAA
ncbi:hypothetical protein BDB00DRAFT_872417 [Zychaea mexicana]|uniref:uncharacterized protein n=1 Tax=Zychaea mexicana TaxID=64656 RepID=UPI0022FEB41B|nr:uncharacterized protein BDB00DRAFT_872417 [Zychaea mexicana]KAI9493313.1 hypothetical protein BDB00DRAFT_872417 [Zychaea mexicana]